MKTIRSLITVLLLGAGLQACVDAAVPVSEPTPASTPIADGVVTTPAQPLVSKRGSSRATQADSEAVADSGFDVRMRRSGCFGRCPSYTVAIHADGSVDFTGERFVASDGAQQGNADPAALQALKDLLATPEIESLGGQYMASNPKKCGQWHTDDVSISLDLTFNGRRRKIEHYLGCSMAPPQLRKLEKAIDEAAVSEHWITGISNY